MEKKNGIVGVIICTQSPLDLEDCGGCTFFFIMMCTHSPLDLEDCVGCTFFSFFLSRYNGAAQLLHVGHETIYPVRYPVGLETYYRSVVE